MSILDRAVAALTPPESDEDRVNARRVARDVAEPGDWLTTVLDQHLQIEQAFDALRDAAPADRPGRFKELATILNGHSLAEEVVLYPAIERGGEKGAAAMAYEEQSMTKVQMARLEMIDPASQDYLDKLEHIRSAVLHHVYEEEGTWLPRLKQSALREEQAVLGQRFNEEYSRYVGNGQSNAAGQSQGLQDGLIGGQVRDQATADLARQRDDDMARDPRDETNMGRTTLA